MTERRLHMLTIAERKELGETVRAEREHARVLAHRAERRAALHAWQARRA
jgi:hypothetical protein